MSNVLLENFTPDIFLIASHINKSHKNSYPEKNFKGYFFSKTNNYSIFVILQIINKQYEV